MARRRWGVTVTMGCVDCSISSLSNSWIKLACMAAPRADRSEGLMAVGDVEGESMVVVGGKRERRLDAMRGVWDVPPERMTSFMSRMSRSAFRMASWIR